MTFPILEHDPEPEAFIEPSKVIRPLDVPEHCVICFFKDVIDKVIAEHKGKMLVEHRWEDGPHPVYEIMHKEQRLAICHPGVGAPAAACNLEFLIAYGCQKFIACGGCGVLEREVAANDLIVVSAAIRDEGTSYHYLPPARQVDAQQSTLISIVHALKSRGVPHHVGMTWTTDAPFRETPNRIAQRQAEGCLVVEMEAAAMMAVAQFRDVVFGQVLYGGDDLSGAEWEYRDWQSRSDVRENLFWLCADACLTL